MKERSSIEREAQELGIECEDSGKRSPRYDTDKSAIGLLQPAVDLIGIGIDNGLDDRQTNLEAKTDYGLDI